MTKYSRIGMIDQVAIEREARRMQAEAIAHGARSMRNWLRGTLRRRPQNGVL